MPWREGELDRAGPEVILILWAVSGQFLEEVVVEQMMAGGEEEKEHPSIGLGQGSVRSPMWLKCWVGEGVWGDEFHCGWVLAIG